jgi:hypothetical protein
MKAWVWVIIALIGFAVMLGAYASRERNNSDAPWSEGLIVMSREASAEKVRRAGAIPARLRLLSSSDVAEMLLFATGDLVPDKALGVKGQVRVKLIGLPLAMVGIGADWLSSGRLPEAGHNEVLAGGKIEASDMLLVGGQSLKVVGTLKPAVALFATSYLIPTEAIATDATNRLFPAEVPTVFHAWLVPNSAEELRDPKVRNELEESFPLKQFAWVTPQDRLEPRAFYAYLSGLAIFLLGGSGALIGLFRWLADKVTSPFFAAPLLEMKARPRLVWCVHLLYFGLAIGFSLHTYEIAEVQVVLLGKVREALTTKSNPLGIAGEAYLSGNIPLAAAVTFAINFLLGSLTVITLPSVLVPGVGAFVAGLFAAAWGLILAPATQTLAFSMLPHSGTMLLEGEGYILATIFGLLVPIHIVKRSLGGNLFTRFGRVLMLNFKANCWIALVLAVAAIYEATEVILMNR